MPSYSRFVSARTTTPWGHRSEKHAPAAAGPPRSARRPPVGDQEQVRLEHARGRHELRQDGVGLVCARARRDQAQPQRHPVDVRVDRHHGHIQAEQQDTARGFGADPGKRHQPGDRLGRRKPAEPVEVRPAVLGELCEHGLDARRLLRGQAARAQHVLELRRGGVAHLLPGREPLAHGCIGTLAVAIARVLAQDREHELVQRRQPAVNPRRSVAPAQAVEDAVDRGHVPREPRHG